MSKGRVEEGGVGPQVRYQGEGTLPCDVSYDACDHVLTFPPPRQTDACENIAFSQFRLQVVAMGFLIKQQQNFYLGFAFVRYYDKRDAEDAMDAMDGAIFDGRELRVQMARYGRPSEPYRRGGPRGGGRRRRYEISILSKSQTSR